MRTRSKRERYSRFTEDTGSKAGEISIEWESLFNNKVYSSTDLLQYPNLLAGLKL